jgi:hypothetical protein
LGGPGFKCRPGALYLDGDTSLFSLAWPDKYQDAADRGYFVLHPPQLITHRFRTEIFSILNKASFDSPNRIQSMSIKRTNWSVLCVEMIGVLLSTKTHCVSKLQSILGLRLVINFVAVEL